MDSKMTNCIMTVSSVVDQYPGLRDPLSLDLYDWNDRLKGTFELNEIHFKLRGLKR